ncbi:hypothetical protein CHS0354_022127 [Potamilus streckersoni]|uniref:Uncharacterized protein n=1 Tax=Potamilus streckersoni TaxID=2493646 RepID=A0AAE0VIQ5_9BIVA|nr:hypothetical protein CHS0354_022127 [Potamilus streckersoni]
MAILRRVIAIAVICMVTSHVTTENTYMFVLPPAIRPGIPLSVRGMILKANVAPVSVTASLKRIQEKPNELPIIVTETSQTLTGVEESRIDVMVPENLGSGKYEIHIEGKGGVSFKNSRSISYEPKSASIFIQTDKAIYKPGQTVHFRILAVNPDLKVVKGPMDIDLYDPSGNKINQWKGVEDPSGVFEGQQIMSDQPILGDWKITVVMTKMKEEKAFTVDEYVLPKFEVAVNLPSFGLTTDKMFKGSITAKYTFGKPVKGKVNLRIKSKYNNNIWRNGQMLPAPVTEKTFPIEGKASFEVTMKELSEIDSSLDSSYLTFEVNVTETLTGITQSGSGEVQFFDGPIKMEFPDSLPKVFKPGMTYKAFLKVSQRDGLPPVNAQGKVNVTVTYYTPRSQQITKPPFESFWSRRQITWPSDDEKKLPPLLFDIPMDGIISFPLVVPLNVKRVSMQANYDKASASLLLQKSHSPSNNYIQIRLLDNDLTAGDTANFEIKATENPSKIHHQILSKGNIVRSGTISFSQGSGQQMQVPLDSSMAPKAKLIVYYIRPDGEIVADGINFNLKGIFRNRVSVKFDKLTAQPQDSLTLQLTADPGSKVNVLAVDKSVLLLKSGNDITPDEVNKELQSYDSSSGGKDEPVPFWLWRWPTPSGGNDASEVFDKAGLTVITDANLYKYIEPFIHPRPVPMFAMARGAAAMDSLSAVSMVKQNSAVQLAPAPPPAVQDLKPVQRIRKLFPETWLWQNATVNNDGTAAITTTVPDTITSWVASAFAVHPNSGFGVAEETASLETFMPFFVSLQLPYSVVRGEKIILQANIFNYLSTAVYALVTLPASVDYKNVMISASGREEYSSNVSSYVYINAGEAVPVYFPIIPQKLGKIDIEVSARSENAADAVRRQLLVEPEGILVESNTPVLIDLKNGGNFKSSVPIAFPNTTVEGSKRIQARIIGDLMGPSINGLDSLIRMPYGCGEQNMLNFAPNIFITKYLEVTNNLSPDVKEKSKEYMIKGYQRELTYQHTDGSFSAFGNSDPSGSTWLTAFVLKSFVQARPYIYVDDNVNHKAVDWLLTQQNKNGTFNEPGKVLHKEMQGGSTAGARSLTAFVLVALLEASKIPGMEDKIRSATKSSLSRLEQDVNDLTDVYEVAIISYVLMLANSPQASVALAKLNTLAKTEDGQKYWVKNDDSPTKIVPEYPIKKEKAINIETTAYALMSLALANDAHNGLMVLKWLTRQRNPYGGFSSTQDTVVALQALAEMASRVYSKDFNISIQLIGTPGSGFIENATVNPVNSLVLQSFDIPNNVTELTISAAGQGLGLVEIATFYNVESDTQQPSFALEIMLPNEDINSYTVKVCGRYLKNGVSSMTVMEIGTPSGFVADKSSIKDAPFIKKIEEGDKKLILYFDELGQEKTCVSTNVQRVGLVAGAALVPVRIYDYYSPEDEVTAFYVPAVLRNSDVCDVCGAECDFCKWDPKKSAAGK